MSRGVTSRRPPALAGLVLACGITVGSILPLFMVAALWSQAPSGSLSAAQVGGLGLTFNLAAAVSSPPLGRLIDRHDTRGAAATCAALSAIVLLGLALATSHTHLFLLLGLGGLLHALGHATANALLGRRIAPRRRGLVFGLKQAAIPMASLVAGAAVPLASTGLGWRTMMAAAAVIVLTLTLMLRWLPAGDSRTVDPPSDNAANGSARSLTLSVALAALAGALGAAGAGCLPLFLVPTAMHSGMTGSQAGAVLSLASLAAISGRAIAGWYVDRTACHPSLTVAAMLLSGAAGALLVATGLQLATVLGAALAFGMGWSWNTVLHYSVVNENPITPSASLSIVQAGLFVGGALGPVTFGIIAEHGAYTAGWTAIAAAMCLAGLLAHLGGRVGHRRNHAG